jgi:hypothetical protein
VGGRCALEVDELHLIEVDLHRHARLELALLVFAHPS